MVAIQFKCTYNQYRKLTVWHTSIFRHADPFKWGTPGDEDTRQEAIDDSQWVFSPTKEYSDVQRIITCTTCTDLSTIGYDNTLCSMSGRPFTPQQRVHKKHPTISAEDLIKKKDLLDPLDDDDESKPIRYWLTRRARWDTRRVNVKDHLQRISSTADAAFNALVLEFIDQSSSRTCSSGTNGDYPVIGLHSEEKQKEIRKQVDALLKLGVIKESQASEWSQVHLVPKPTPEGAP